LHAQRFHFVNIKSFRQADTVVRNLYFDFFTGKSIESQHDFSASPSRIRMLICVRYQFRDDEAQWNRCLYPQVNGIYLGFQRHPLRNHAEGLPKVLHEPLRVGARLKLTSRAR
jgi:hypothetical protein